MVAKANPVRDPELLPDAWQRFERAVDVVMKSPPQHRTAKPKPKAVKSSRGIGSKPKKHADKAG